MRHAIATSVLLGMSLATAQQPALAQDVLFDYERESFDSPEGWAMAHTVSASLNLGAGPAATLERGDWRVSAELGSIPHLSREEQRVGFGGYKLEDMNKSPVFGRGRLHVGLPGAITAELSWTPPLEINGGKPQHLFGVALERNLWRGEDWSLGGRLFALRGDARGDTTCSRSVARQAPGSAGNLYGCRAPSDDTLRMDHEGIELMLSRRVGDGRWQPFVALASTHMNPYVEIEALVFDSLDLSELESSGTVQTLSAGTQWRVSPQWQASLALSWTPLDVRRPPQFNSASQDYWSVRVGLGWQP
jgi:hypothetical protein